MVWKEALKSITHDSLEPVTERIRIPDLSLSVTYTESFFFAFAISICLLLAVSLKMPLVNALSTPGTPWSGFVSPKSELGLMLFFFSLFIDFPQFSTLRALLDVSFAPDDLMRSFSLRTLIVSLNFKIYVSQELLTSITRPSQISGRLDNKTSALISSSKLIPIDSKARQCVEFVEMFSDASIILHLQIEQLLH